MSIRPWGDQDQLSSRVPGSFSQAPSAVTRCRHWTREKLMRQTSPGPDHVRLDRIHWTRDQTGQLRMRGVMVRGQLHRLMLG